jgi:2-polyprenyl-3-methyl-5-hydroxy-6-metoxy-1,4-benzoquinol methylase
MESNYDAYFDANRKGWDLKTGVNAASSFYNLEGWKAGNSSLNPIELKEVGEVKGKKLLHLQCHFGMDTLSWAREGAQVTGVDFSAKAVRMARKLAKESSLKARFVQCNVYDLPQHLSGKYDVVFTSYGTIGWLPDLEPWAKVVAHFLKRKGFFYIADFHPFVWMMDDDMQYIKYPYHNAGVIETEQVGSYADRYASIKYTEYGWNHSLSDIINSLIRQGLRIEFLNEYSYSPYDCFSNTVKGADGNYRIKGFEDVLPMMYSIKASKP